jgi:hypothetical protein
MAYRNPSETQVDALGAKDPHNAIRWFRTKDGDVWVFIGGNIYHEGAAYELGIPSEELTDRGNFFVPNPGARNPD